MRHKLLLIHQGGELYGSDRMLALVCRALSTGADVHLVLDAEGPLVDLAAAHCASIRVRRLGVLRRANARRPVRLAQSLAELVSASLWVAREARSGDYEAVYSSTLAVWAGAFGARIAQVPHVWHLHELLDQDSWVARRALALCASLSWRVLCVSEAVRSAVASASSEGGDRAVLVPNCLAPEVAESLLHVPLREYDERCLRLLVIGRLSERKGQRQAIEALAALRERAIPATLSLVGEAYGDSDYEEELCESARELGVADEVSIQGFLSDPTAAYDAADVVVIPSQRPESFCLVALEAMAAGRPVVVSPLEAVVELVQDGATGIVCSSTSPQGLADGIARLAEDGQLRARLALAGRVKAKVAYGYDVFAARLGQLLLESVPGREAC